MPRMYGPKIKTVKTPDAQSKIGIRLSEPGVVGGDCVSQIESAQWIGADDGDLGDELGDSVMRDAEKYDGDNQFYVLGDWSVIGTPIGAACPDCELTWRQTTGGDGLNWIQAGDVIFIPGTYSVYNDEGPWHFDLSIDCSESGESGVVAGLDFAVDITVTEPDF